MKRCAPRSPGKSMGTGYRCIHVKYSINVEYAGLRARSVLLLRVYLCTYMQYQQNTQHTVGPEKHTYISQFSCLTTFPIYKFCADFAVAVCCCLLLFKCIAHRDRIRLTGICVWSSCRTELHTMPYNQLQVMPPQCRFVVLYIIRYRARIPYFKRPIYNYFIFLYNTNQLPNIIIFYRIMMMMVFRFGGGDKNRLSACPPVHCKRWRWRWSMDWPQQYAKCARHGHGREHKLPYACKVKCIFLCWTQKIYRINLPITGHIYFIETNHKHS